MFAFTLVTRPVFFLVAYLAMQLGTRLEKWFMRFVAVVVLVLGLISVNSGLSLMGSQLAFSNLLRPLALQPAEASYSQVPSAELTLTAANNGYFPKTLYAVEGQAIRMNIITDRTFRLSSL